MYFWQDSLKILRGQIWKSVIASIFSQLVLPNTGLFMFLCFANLVENLWQLLRASNTSFEVQVQILCFDGICLTLAQGKAVWRLLNLSFLFVCFEVCWSRTVSGVKPLSNVGKSRWMRFNRLSWKNYNLDPHHIKMAHPHHWFKEANFWQSGLAIEFCLHLTTVSTVSKSRANRSPQGLGVIRVFLMRSEVVSKFQMAAGYDDPGNFLTSFRKHCTK